MLEQEAYRIKQETKKIYGFFPTSAKKVAEYLGLPNCQQATIESFLSTKPAAKKRKLAQARSLTAGAASKKLVPIIRRTVNSARLHDCFRYWGAWTGRLTSLGVQLQNLVREPSDEEWFEKLNKPKSKFANVFKGVRNNIRGFIQAAVGYVLISGDYNAIECRVSAWLAGEEWLLKAFRDGEDPYLIMASEIFGETITDKEDPRRQLGKIVELGSQYQLGWEALQARCLQDDIRLSKRQAQEIVIAYRTLHANIVKCWALSEKTFIDAMHLLPGEHITLTNGIRFERIEHAVKVVRRSGFAQYYWNPRMEMGHWKNCDYSHCNGCKEDICYTGRRKTGAMGKKTTYGGDIFQGYVQGTALDYMLEGMTNVEEAGYPPVMSVHDDITCEIEDDGEDYTEDYNDRLCRSPKWAKGLPIKAECWQQRRYTK
jgi:DNA polymerase